MPDYRSNLAARAYFSYSIVCVYVTKTIINVMLSRIIHSHISGARFRNRAEKQSLFISGVQSVQYKPEERYQFNVYHFN